MVENYGAIFVGDVSSRMSSRKKLCSAGKDTKTESFPHWFCCFSTL